MSKPIKIDKISTRLQNFEFGNLMSAKQSYFRCETKPPNLECEEAADFENGTKPIVGGRTGFAKTSTGTRRWGKI